MSNSRMMSCPCLMVLAFGVLAGCGESTPVEPARKQMVYVDTATMKPMVHDVATSFPAVHPTTGKPTLRPALYCPTCQKWHPVPPPDQINRVRGAGQCSKDQTPLIADGPWPSDPTPAK